MGIKTDNIAEETTTAQPKQMTLPVTNISFPEIKLRRRDAHKLRGFFGNYFKQHSPLLHNHYDNGELRYAYPLVQYKVLESIPTLIGVREGADLLPKLFLRMEQIDIDGRIYPVHSKNIQSNKYTIGYDSQLQEYKFTTAWMALNQDGYDRYMNCINDGERKALLDKRLVNNILSFYRNMGLKLDQTYTLMASTRLQKGKTNFKNQKMLTFTGSFSVNALLPDMIGLGKSAARGFGTIKRI